MRVRDLREVLALAVTTAMGCGSTAKDTDMGEAPKPGPATTPILTSPLAAAANNTFASPFACGEALEQMRLAIKADYLELRTYRPGTARGKADGGAGTPCKTATSVPACESTIEKITSTDSLYPNCGNCAPMSTALLVTRGDDVNLISSGRELKAATGEIDAAAEAFYVASSFDYQVLCGSPWIRRDPDGFVVYTRKLINDCPMTHAEIDLLVGHDGTVREVSRTVLPGRGGCAGRRPPGLLAARGATGSSVVGTYFAQIARLEAASVTAFDVLARELRAHRAPARLIRAAERARRDEVRHATTTRALAERFGGVVTPPRVRSTRVRSLRAIAIENAREGCVRETWGALEATWQAAHATDRGVRRSMRVIARDETRHAALSWQVAAWAERKLDERGRAAVSAARSEAAAQLARELAGARDPQLVAVAGLPDERSTGVLFESLRTQLAVG